MIYSKIFCKKSEISLREILINKIRDQRLLNLIYLNFLCVSFDQLACLHEWSRTATHMHPIDMPLTPLDECARDCCIIVRTRDPHGVRASCRAGFLSGYGVRPPYTTSGFELMKILNMYAQPCNITSTAIYSFSINSARVRINPHEWTQEFFWDGIHKLPERWEKFIASDGQYFE